MTTTERLAVANLAPGNVIVANAVLKSESRYKVVTVEPVPGNTYKVRLTMTQGAQSFTVDKYKTETFNILKQ